MKIVWRALINAAAIAIAAFFVPGITYGNTSYGYGDADKYISLLLTGPGRLALDNVIHTGL